MNQKKIHLANKPVSIQLQRNKLPATWLVRKFCLIKWPSHHCGLLISIVNITEFIDQLGIATGDYRQILAANLPFNNLKKFNVKILKLGTLEECLKSSVILAATLIK